MQNVDGSPEFFWSGTTALVFQIAEDILMPHPIRADLWADRRTPTRVLSYSRTFSRSFVQAASFRTAMTSLRGLITREINEISRLKSVGELRGFDTVSWFHFGRKVRQPGRFSASTRSSAMQPGVERAHNRGVLQQCEASKAPSVTIIRAGAHTL
jgi:hypothetical protein